MTFPYISLPVLDDFDIMAVGDDAFRSFAFLADGASPPRWLQPLCLRMGLVPLLQVQVQVLQVQVLSQLLLFFRLLLVLGLPHWRRMFAHYLWTLLRLRRFL